MRRIFVLTVTAILWLGLTPVAVLGTQHNPPWAHVISQDWGAPAVSTQIRWGSPWLRSSGYTVYDPINLSSGSTYGYWMNDDSLFLYAGHGFSGGGGLVFPNGGGYGYIYAEDRLYPWLPNSDPYYFLANSSTGQMGDNLLAVFIGCDTAKTGPRYGNLLDMSRARGTDCAIGWNREIILSDSPGIFGMGFMRGVWDRNLPIDSPVGYHPNDADLMAYAYNYMMSNSGGMDWRLADWTTRGQYAQKLRPARYGAW